jgi:hypothetical protein
MYVHRFLPLLYPIDISHVVPKPSRPGWITVARATSGRFWTTTGRHSSAALTRLSYQRCVDPHVSTYSLSGCQL